MADRYLLEIREDREVLRKETDLGAVRAAEVRIKSAQWLLEKFQQARYGLKSKLEVEQLTTVVFRNYTGIEWEEAARQRALTGEPPPLLPGVPESVPVVDIGQSLPVEEPSPEEQPTRKVAKLQGGKQTGEPLIRETPRRGRAIL